jgi:hypothetical protein
MGIGFKINGAANRDDFANILGVWSGHVRLDDNTLVIAHHVAEQVAQHVRENAPDGAVDGAIANALSVSSLAGIAAANPTSQALSQEVMRRVSSGLVSKVLAEKTGAKVAGKLSTKVAAKTGGKIATKYAAKGASAWVPVISAAVCGGLNAWIMSGILDSAETYFTQLKVAREKRYAASTRSRGARRPSTPRPQ